MAGTPWRIPAEHSAFTWAWDEEPDLPERPVSIELTLLDGSGTRLALTHGPYGDGLTEAEDRKAHVEGWRHFLPRPAAGDTRGG